MTALQFLERQTRRQLAGFTEAVRSIPADKMEWQPAPGARSALNILQEVATITDLAPELYETRKLEFTPEMGAKMEQEMQKTSDVETLLKMCEESTERELERLRGVKVEDYHLPVEMPWFDNMEVLDIMNYHIWNMSYHEGQINYIASLLEQPEDNTSAA